MSNKSKILKAASTLLIEHGASGLSVRKIASLVGVSTIGIYSHFQGKQGILEALYIQGYQRLYDAMYKATIMNNSEEAVIQGCRDYISMSYDYEAEYRLIFGETNGDYTPGPNAIEARMLAFSRLVNIVSRLLPTDASADTQQRAALRVWATLHGYVSIHHHVVKETISRESWSSQALSAVQSIIEELQIHK